MRALQLSKSEEAPLSSDGVVLLRLTVPCTDQQVTELGEMGFDLTEHHILALSSDKAAIEKALKDLPRKRRPCLSREETSGPHVARGSDEIQSEGFDEGGVFDQPVLVVEKAFDTDSSFDFPSWAPHDAVATEDAEMPL